MQEPREDNTLPETVLQTAMQRSVECATVRQHPFPHLLITDILPQEIYQGLISNLPSWSDLRPIALAGGDLSEYHKRSSMLIYPPESRADHHLNSELLRAAALLASRELTAIFMGRLGSILTDAMRVEVRIDCDQEGACMTPHTDSPGKVATLITYLHSGHNGIESGTRLAVPRQSWLATRRESDYSEDSYQHEADSDFITVQRIPFISNTALAFVRSPRSFHSYGPVAAWAAPRYILNLSVKYDDADEGASQ
jgi:hypothetical protein